MQDMTKEIIVGKSSGKNIKIQLDVLLRTRLLIQANSGKGKSWLLRRLAEQFFGKVQIIIIDPEGEFATLREKFDFVLVGKGGEIQAHPKLAAMTAQRILELNISAICDLYEMKPSDRHAYVRIFLEAMIDAPKNLWHPVIIILDEAHVYCPEKGAGESEASEAVISLATRGRKRGYCLIPATQRLGKLRKDVAAELLNVMIGGTFIDIDRKRAADALGVYGVDQRAFFDEIKLLKPGIFHVLGPAISNERVLIEVGPVETTHPEAGSGKHAVTVPPPLAKVKALLPKLSDLPKEAEERAKNEAELRVEVRSLKAQLRSQPKPDIQIDSKIIERAVALERKQWEEKNRSINRILDNMKKALGDIAHSAAKAAAIEVPAIPIKPTIVIPRPRMEQSPDVEHKDMNGKLRAGAMRMLAAVVTWHPNGMTEGQMRSHAGLKKSGTFSAYMSDLRTGQYIEERGGMIYATELGLEHCKHAPSSPTSTEEVLSVWNPKLRDGARRMLKVLVEAGGELIQKEELGERANLKKSGTFSAYLSDLKTARLVTITRDGIAADKDTLFL